MAFSFNSFSPRTISGTFLALPSSPSANDSNASSTTGELVGGGELVEAGGSDEEESEKGPRTIGVTTGIDSASVGDENEGGEGDSSSADVGLS